ncbi:MAG: 2-oxoacid:ferredoxin oxidoreductase subunit beta [Desulfotignum sp.]|nr:2-oxoacid:ferredoxin oxidoreductase subunit beta [Desulfotignum sp.]
MSDTEQYSNDYENKWCPGCGNFGILSAIKKSLADMRIPPEEILMISGIGQAAKTPHFLHCNYFHGLHGRALPVATGAKLADPDLTLLVNMGDGDCYGEGGNHLLAALRRNINFTLLVHNNMVYGLTKGQASPTSRQGFVTRAQPQGVAYHATNPLALALSQGAGFVARGYCREIDHLSQLINEAVAYPGFSLIDVLQVCVSFNNVNTYDFFNDRVYILDEKTYQADDLHKAYDMTMEWEDKIPIGIIYRKETKSYADGLAPLQSGPLFKQAYDPDNIRRAIAGT